MHGEWMQLRAEVHGKLQLRGFFPSWKVSNQKKKSTNPAERQSILVLWSWSSPGMWEMWVHPAVAGGTPFPGACLSFPPVCLKLLEGGAVNNMGTFRTGLCWEIACRNAKYGIFLCKEQMINWPKAECEAAPLTLSPSNLHPPSAASMCACPELKQFWQDSQVL